MSTQKYKINELVVAMIDDLYIKRLEITSFDHC